jgi:hypothetical protein
MCVEYIEYAGPQVLLTAPRGGADDTNSTLARASVNVQWVSSKQLF